MRSRSFRDVLEWEECGIVLTGFSRVLNELFWRQITSFRNLRNFETVSLMRNWCRDPGWLIAPTPILGSVAHVVFLEKLVLSAKWDWFPLLPTQRRAFVCVSAPFPRYVPSWGVTAAGWLLRLHHQRCRSQLQKPWASSPSSACTEPRSCKFTRDLEVQHFWYVYVWGTGNSSTARNGRDRGPGLCDSNAWPLDDQLIHCPQLVWPSLPMARSCCPQQNLPPVSC